MAPLPCIGLYKPRIDLPFGDGDCHVLWLPNCKFLLMPRFRFCEGFTSRYGCWTKKRGKTVKPPKWMVYFMEKPIRMDDLGVKMPLFLVQHPYEQKHPQITGVADPSSALCQLLAHQLDICFPHIGIIWRSPKAGWHATKIINKLDLNIFWVWPLSNSGTWRFIGIPEFPTKHVTATSWWSRASILGEKTLHPEEMIHQTSQQIAIRVSSHICPMQHQNETLQCPMRHDTQCVIA